MKINLARSAGFCFGVRRAINIALHTASRKKNVYMLGDIVHNEQVVADIRRAGIRKAGRLGEGKGKTLILRAHGASRLTLKKAQGLGYEIIDATCPMVKEIHKIAMDMEKRGRSVIIIGDKKHAEVQGIIGQLKNKAVVIDAAGNIPLGAVKKLKKACVVAQSTQNMEKVLKIVGLLKKHIGDLKFFNTICGPTRLKQEEIKRMPLENDIMIVIGSKTSANTRRLYEISRSINKKTYWITSKKDLKGSWLKGVRTVGLTGGASTPDATIREVLDHLKKLAHGALF